MKQSARVMTTGKLVSRCNRSFDCATARFLLLMLPAELSDLVHGVQIKKIFAA